VTSGTSVNAIDEPASPGQAGVLKTSCVYTGEFRPEENKAILESELYRATCTVVAGSLVVSRMNTPDLVGAAGLVKNDDPFLFLPDRLWLVSFQDCDPQFMNYWCKSVSYRSQVQLACSGTSSSMQNLSQDNFYSFIAPLPSAAEQSAIATFLDQETAKIDALIAEQQRLIQLLQEKRQAVISHAVTKGLNPDAPMKDSGVEWLGEVPEHWRNFRLKALFALKHGYAFDGSQFSEEGEYALMTPGNFIETGGFRRKDPEKYYVGSDMPSEFILQGGEMLIAMTEQAPGLVGTALIAPEGEHYLHNQRLGLVTRLKAEELDTSFLYWLMNSPVLKAKVGVTAAGQKVRHTSPQKILDNEICLPPLEEQRIIAQALFEANERCIKLTESACTSIQLLVERRSALISAAVTGQIDVRGLVAEAEAA